MIPTLTDACVTVGGQVAECPPAGCGIYRLFGDERRLLYVGKSINIRSRLASHYRSGREPGREQRMLHGVRAIDCELFAGEVGALLAENAAIKSEMPLYNRRQRRQRRLFTLQLKPGLRGFLLPEPVTLGEDDTACSRALGIYRSITHARSVLASLVREHALCPQILGLENGHGACFQYQLRRCRGACAGRETPSEHNARLQGALEGRQLAAWPFSGAILLEEVATDCTTGQPPAQWHRIEQWAYLGSYSHRDTALRATATGTDFDRDTYHILLNALSRDALTLRCGTSGDPVYNPFCTDAAAG